MRGPDFLHVHTSPTHEVSKRAKAKQVELRANEQKRQTKRRKERINGRRRVERAGEKKQLKLASSPWSWQDLWSHKMRG